MTATFRFRPRYRGVAWTAIGIGGSLATAASIIGFVILPLATGAIGIAIGAAYLASPTWKLAVVVDDAGYAVTSRGREKFRVAWSEVVRVVASPSTQTCFIDAGTPARSLLVPGDGAPAPYAIERRADLFALVVAHVGPDAIETVETLERAAAVPPVA